MSILWEDLEWIKPGWEGIAGLGLFPREEVLANGWGVKVTCNKAEKPCGAMCLLPLRPIIGAGAEFAIGVGSWFINAESFVKQ